MHIHGYPWISMHTHGYPWVFMDIHRYLWIPMDLKFMSILASLSKKKHPTCFEIMMFASKTTMRIILANDINSLKFGVVQVVPQVK